MKSRNKMIKDPEQFDEMLNYSTEFHVFKAFPTFLSLNFELSNIATTQMAHRRFQPTRL